MKGIKYVNGDATQPRGSGNAIICHVCNDIGGWGRGFVLAISKRWKEPEASYREWYRLREENDFALGATQIVRVDQELWVANMVSQHGIHSDHDGPPIRYDALGDCVRSLADSAMEFGASIHMPRIGCGLAGGLWENIEPILDEHLISKRIAVHVYDFD